MYVQESSFSVLSISPVSNYTECMSKKEEKVSSLRTICNQKSCKHETNR
jgi:hypothetical protein